MLDRFSSAHEIHEDVLLEAERPAQRHAGDDVAVLGDRQVRLEQAGRHQDVAPHHHRLHQEMRVPEDHAVRPIDY